MNKFRRNVERLANQRSEYVDLKKGRTSRLDSNGVPEADPSQDARIGYINVRLDNGRSQVEIVIGPLMRPNWERIPDLPVDTGINLAGKRVCIKPSDPNDQQIDVYGNSLSSPTIETRVFGSQNFAPGMLHAWEVGGYGLNVYVEPFIYRDRVVSGVLAVTVPAGAGTRYQGVVYYDYDANALGIAYGTASSSPALLFNQQTAAAIDIGGGERIRLFAVLLDNWQTDVLEDPARFYDLRDWLNPVAAPPSIAVDDGTSTVDPTTLLTFDPTYFDVTDGGGANALVTFIGGAGSAFPNFGTAAIKTLSSDKAAAGSDRNLVLAAQTGTADNCIEITGLAAGDAVLLRADTGDTITVKHNDAGATDKIMLHAAVDLVLSGNSTLLLMKTESGKVAQSVDQGYASVQDEGTPVTQRSAINFVGAGVTVSDGGGVTSVSIPGGGGGGAGGNVTVGTYAGSRPASPNDGDMYIVKDGHWWEIFHNTIWNPYKNNLLLTTPPSTGWSWDNQGTASVDATLGAHYLSVPGGSAAVNLRVRYRTAPSTPYTITAWLEPNNLTVAYHMHGILFRQSSSGKIHALMLQGQGTTKSLWSLTYTDPLNFTGSSYAVAAAADVVRFFQISDDGINRICRYSADGLNWILFTSIGRTDFITADQVGFFVSPQNASWGAAATLYSWKVS